MNEMVHKLLDKKPVLALAEKLWADMMFGRSDEQLRYVEGYEKLSFFMRLKRNLTRQRLSLSVVEETFTEKTVF